MPALLQDPHLLYVECAACGEAVSQSFQGLVSTLPQVQAFWRRHPRLRMVRQHEIEAAGQSALVTSLESGVDTARLDVVIARDSLRLLSSHGPPATERNT
jgi:hypothetical protein